MKLNIQPDDLFNVPEVTELLGVGRNTIYNALSNGSLKSFKIGNLRRIRGSAILEMIERGESKPFEEKRN